MFRHLAPILAFSVAVFAQGPIRTVPLPSSIVQYLELTTVQSNSIGALYVQLAQFIQLKSQRAAQVQLEISQETAKETIDAMALGQRYLEIEAIRREISGEQQKTITAVQNVLTAAQKAKLAILEEALRSYPTACDAVNYYFISPPAASFVFSGIPAGAIGAVLTTSPSCVGIPALGFRTGDFTFTQTPPPPTSAP